MTAHTQTSHPAILGALSEPGTYRVTVQAAGFQKSVTDNVGLVVDQQARANVSLKTGTVSETVEVQASAAALDTDSSAVSQTVTERQVDELPLNGRNFLNLLFISAGAVQTVGEMGRCDKEKATPSASMAVGLNQTTIPWTDLSTPTQR